MFKYQNAYQCYLDPESHFKERVTENNICKCPVMYIHQLTLTTAALMLLLLTFCL